RRSRGRSSAGHSRICDACSMRRSMTRPPPASMSSFRDAPQYLFRPGELDIAWLVAEAADGDGDCAGGQEREQLVRPLDHRHSFPVEHFLYAQVNELGEATRPVGVDVVDAQAALILVDEHEGGAGHLGLYAEAPREALEQAGLARPQG